VPRTVAVKAPLSGVYYQAPSPGEDPFVTAGQTVGPDDVVALIESMKLFIEVRAETRGVVTAILVQNEQHVSNGQVLLEVETP
jgi:acetyl-CoA carboxylase biotin carboxyl carrier protein